MCSLTLVLGIFCPEFSLCDGIESQMMVNHLSHFHLTLSLLPNLNSPSRVINVSSEAGHHLKSTNLDFNELNDAKKYSKINGYSMSKLSQILFTKILTQKLGVDSNIYVHALHPGRVGTTKTSDSYILCSNWN